MSDQNSSEEHRAAGAFLKLGAQVVGSIAPEEALAALNNVVDAGREYLVLRERESTKRAEIAAYRTLESERIKAAERVLTAYFEQVFNERSENFTQLWRRLDEAAEQGNAARVSETLSAIVAVAQKSPLAELGDLGQLRAALNDPDRAWEL